MRLTPDVLKLDLEKTADALAATLRDVVVDTLKRRGMVVGLSGGIDSSVTAGLAVRAFGKERVVGLLMPETDSADETLGLSQSVADALGIETVHEDITPILKAARCYERRDEAIRKVVPGFGPGWKSKIVLPDVLQSSALRFYSVVVQDPSGKTEKVRMTTEAYLGVVAATNFKQRTRTMLEYYHADRLNYAVGGTPNRLEYDQGFFVKGGDGLADVKPIAHLYKTQVYALAEVVGIPASVRARRPTTDTYSLPQSQDEFYFSLPYERMDLALWAKNNGVSPADAAAGLELTTAQVERVYADIEQKRRTTRPLHLHALLLAPVPEVHL
ncbi:MAG: NAD(+) synthase [Deltaproteobacteria bacterium]|nr:NAD(+) synthase [Deltaproteobacteria bacterium]